MGHRKVTQPPLSSVENLSVADLVRGLFAEVLDRALTPLRESLSRLERAQVPQFLTIAQAADSLGCHKTTVRRMCKAGSLVYKYVGTGRNAIRVDASSLHGAGRGTR